MDAFNHQSDTGPDHATRAFIANTDKHLPSDWIRHWEWSPSQDVLRIIGDPTGDSGDSSGDEARQTISNWLRGIHTDDVDRVNRWFRNPEQGSSCIYRRIDRGGRARRVETVVWRVRGQGDHQRLQGWDRWIPADETSPASPGLRFYREFTETHDFRLTMSTSEPPTPSVLPLLLPWLRFRADAGTKTLDVRQLPGAVLCSTCGQRISSDHLMLQVLDHGNPIPGHLMAGLFRQPYAGTAPGMPNPLQHHDKTIHRDHCHVQVGSGDSRTHLSLLVPRPPIGDLMQRSPDRIRLLLVDDDPRIATYLGTVLLEQGYDVSTFNDPIYAHAQLRRQPVDVLITDVEMPEMSGTLLAGIARSLQPGIQVIFCSGDPHALDGQLEHIRGFQEEDWSRISKPVDAAELVRQVGARLDRAREVSPVRPRAWDQSGDGAPGHRAGPGPFPDC